MLLKVLKCFVLAKSEVNLLLADPNAAFSLAIAADSLVENMPLTGPGAGTDGAVVASA